MADLASAYRLLRKFKEGRIRAGRRVSKADCELIILLAKDLLPHRAVTGIDEKSSEKIISEIANADTKWNHALMETLDIFYASWTSGRHAEARHTIESFVRKCPSLWYTELAKAALRAAQ